MAQIRMLLLPIAIAPLLAPPTDAAVGGGVRPSPANTSRVAPCWSTQPKAVGEREAEAGSAVVFVWFAKRGSASCHLAGAPKVRSASLPDGILLRTTTANSDNGSSQPQVLAPPRSAVLLLMWSYWCGGAPGDVAARITLPGSAGTFVVSLRFTGYVAVCNISKAPSTFADGAAYSKAGPGTPYGAPPRLR